MQKVERTRENLRSLTDFANYWKEGPLRPGGPLLASLLGRLVHLRHAMRRKHRLPADRFLQHQTHDAQIHRRSTGYAAQTRQPAGSICGVL
jgi:hypothetical protein